MILFKRILLFAVSPVTTHCALLTPAVSSIACSLCHFGEGALRIHNKTVEYYSTAAASIGFQLGAQSKAVVLVFMKDKTLADFRKSGGWEAGVDGSVALIEWGVGRIKFHKNCTLMVSKIVRKGNIEISFRIFTASPRRKRRDFFNGGGCEVLANSLG